MAEQKTVFIAAISSDIGQQLANIYLENGWSVIGTYRNADQLNQLSQSDKVQLIQCDVNLDEDILRVASFLKQRQLYWDEFVSAVGLLEPIGSFTTLDVKYWKKSVILNSLQQLDLLHSILPFKASSDAAKVCFLVGGAINRAFPNYSAYSLGKILLVKFCELINSETKDLHCIAVGTGWVASKIHQQTLQAGEDAGDNLHATKDFVDAGEQGTPIIDIYTLIQWCFRHPVTAGRNFSVVHDNWRDGGEELLAELASDEDIFKLRRYGNHHNTQK